MPNLILLNAPGPQGGKGQKGDKGDPGPAGPAGSTLAVSGTGFVHWSGTGADPTARAVNLASAGAGGDVTGLLALANISTTSTFNGKALMTRAGVATWDSVFVSDLSGGTNGQILAMIGSTASWTSLISFDTTVSTASVVQFAGGTQFGSALDSNMATTGHIRTPRQWTMGGATSGADKALMGWSVNVLSIGADNNLLNAVQNVIVAASGACGIYNTFAGIWGLYVQPANNTTQIGSAVGNAGLAIAWSAASPSIITNYNATSFLIQMQAPIGDTTTGPFTIQGQYAFATATGANRTPGNLVFDIGAPTNSGTVEAAFQWTRNGSIIMDLECYPSAPSQHYLFLSSHSDFTNMALGGDGSTFTYVNAGTFAALGLIYANSTALLYFPSSHTVAYFGGFFGTSPLVLDWTTSTTPKVQSGTAATSLTVGTNKTGATLSLQSDAGVNSIIAGNAEIDLLISGNTHVQLTSGTLKGFDPSAHTANLVLDFTTTAVKMQGSTTAVSVTVGSNKSGASLLLQGDAGTTILTLTTLAELATSLIVDSVVAPSAPAASKVTVYVDNADGGLYAIDANSNIYQLAP